MPSLIALYYRMTYCRKRGHRPWLTVGTCRNCGKTVNR
jgi:hypothetical protein